MSTTAKVWSGGALAITLWDFSWYTQAAPGEPFADLEAAFQQTRDRGYNAIRICAAPILLFGQDEIDVSDMNIVPVAAGVGDGTRWYNVAGYAGMDLRARFFELFRLARRYGIKIIVSSWEYQQSPAFLDTSAWHDILSAIPPVERHHALARALDAMINALREAQLDDVVAYVELHNEVDLSRLGEVAGPDEDTYWAQRPYIQSALAYLQSRQPNVLSTISYGIPPYLDMGALPDNAQIAHVHIYVYGVLGALEAWAGVRLQSELFPTPELRSLLRDDAPAYDTWAHAIEEWRLEATGISRSMFYAYDWVDPVKWDAHLYRDYTRYEEAMILAAENRLKALAKWADRRGLPKVIGEGWIGYTPLHADFEDGPIGQYFAERVVQTALELGFSGLVVGSNSAPHHPGWSNIGFQQRVNRMVTASAGAGV